ncbi:hypothetical protein OAU50_02670 [Planctomycetota bacterium]|nr:hypothetical protein [Planctomycetota bacterium]
MRFLTREFAESDLEDSTADFKAGLYHQVYMRHLEEIAGDLPKSVRAFAFQTMGLHMRGLGLIDALEDAGDETLTLTFGVPAQPDVFLSCRYTGVNTDALDEAAMMTIEENGSHILADEFDLAPQQRFEHRLLFGPDGQVGIQFKNLYVEIIQRDDSAPDPQEPQ